MNKIEMYEVFDGKLLATEDKAKEYCADKAREEIDDVLKEFDGRLWTKSDMFNIIMKLIPDYDKGKELSDKLRLIFK